MRVISRFTRKITGTGVPVWLSIIRWFLFLGVTFVVLLAVTFFVLYRSIDIPNANAAFQTQTTNVYYSDGKHKIGSFATQDRQSIPMSQIPASMQAAAVAAEDRTFYTNRGIDIRGIIRAARNNATSGSVSAGGSTITQQYVKVLYLTQERTFTRKIKEAILSIKIYNQLSKSQILEGYLNTIYFGNGAYGIEVASQTYFRHPASKLTVPESAALAAIINSPGYFDPYLAGGKARLVGRYDYVLDGMAKAGTLDPADLAKYKDNLPAFKPKKNSNRYGGTNGFLLKEVESELRAHSFSDTQINGGGLKVVTTFDYNNQRAAVASVEAIRPNGFKDVHQSLVSIQPGTGAVRAMYGGSDYIKSQLNWALIGSQPGSSFKAFAIIAALEDGYSLKTKLDGNSPIRLTPGGTPIENEGDSGGKSFGSVPLTVATAKSINTAFVDLTHQMSNGSDLSIGAGKILAAASQAGLPDKVVKTQPKVAVTSLGVERVPVIDMVNAYATIAANGKRASWYTIETVKDDKGATIYKHKGDAMQSVPQDVSADTISALEGVVKNGTGIKARTVCPTAGKTGTATAGAGHNQHVSSSWFVGFTPKLATAVMYNRGSGSGRLNNYLPTYFGGEYPARTFQMYMNQAVDPNNCGSFPSPANIKSTKGTTFAPPPPTCAKNEHLNGNKTACVANPTPTPTPTTPAPTTPSPTVPTPTVPPTTGPTTPPSTCGPLGTSPC